MYASQGLRNWYTNQVDTFSQNRFFPNLDRHGSTKKIRPRHRVNTKCIRISCVDLLRPAQVWPWRHRRSPCDRIQSSRSSCHCHCAPPRSQRSSVECWNNLLPAGCYCWAVHQWPQGSGAEVDRRTSRCSCELRVCAIICLGYSSSLTPFQWHSLHHDSHWHRRCRCTTNVWYQFIRSHAHGSQLPSHDHRSQRCYRQHWIHWGNHTIFIWMWVHLLLLLKFFMCHFILKSATFSVV